MDRVFAGDYVCDCGARCCGFFGCFRLGFWSRHFFIYRFVDGLARDEEVEVKKMNAGRGGVPGILQLRRGAEDVGKRNVDECWMVSQARFGFVNLAYYCVVGLSHVQTEILQRISLGTPTFKESLHYIGEDF